MEKIEYVAELLPDGHLSLPENIIKLLKLKPHSKLRVQIQPEVKMTSNLSRFCGKWQGDDNESIVDLIYKSRENNMKSDKFRAS